MEALFDFFMGLLGVMAGFSVVTFIVSIATLIGMWVIFTKMGYPGWKGIIPLYNMYILADKLWGNGWLFLLQGVPLLGVIVAIKMYLDLAKKFNKGIGFGIGLALLTPVFLCILAFSGATYDDSVSTELTKL